MKILLGRTNFPTLKRQDEYLTAVAKLLENAYFGLGSVDLKSQLLFDELAKELEVYPEDEEWGSDEDENSEIVSVENKMEDVVDKSSREDDDAISDSVKSHNIVVSVHSIKVHTETQSYASSEDFNEEKSEIIGGRTHIDGTEEELKTEREGHDRSHRSSNTQSAMIDSEESSFEQRLSGSIDTVDTVGGDTGSDNIEKAVQTLVKLRPNLPLILNQ